MLYVDQYNGLHNAETVAELAHKLGYSRGTPKRMYIDGKDGKTYHTGYVIGRYWLAAFNPMRKSVNRAA